MYLYSQSLHALWKDGEFQNDTGHAGNGSGLNNRQAQDQHDVGPLPRGLYTIAPWVMGVRPGVLAKLGPVTAELIPDPKNQMFGRGGFFVHGPELSEGCIVQLEPERLKMAESGDNQLMVIG